MQIAHVDAAFRVTPGAQPDYNVDNPLMRLMGLVAKTELAAEREFYLMNHTQYLFPFESLVLYGPSAPNQDTLDPRDQDVKTDFQKQNLKSFVAGDTQIVRGYVGGDQWTVPFVRFSYDGADTKLSAMASGSLGDSIKVWFKLGDAAAPAPIRVPYNPTSHRYELEVWGYAGNDLRPQLDAKGQAAWDRGELIARPDLVRGSLADFDREGHDDVDMRTVAPYHTMHPVLPLHIELAWADASETLWDSNEGKNHRYEFSMLVRGLDHYLATGTSANPHGGVGGLRYFNLRSNYGRYAGSNELGRRLEEWNFDAFGNKGPAGRTEEFFAIQYEDYHLVDGNAGIGLHRHRDNQEEFFLVSGRALMVIADWNVMPHRGRAFEVRTLRARHGATLRGGQLHALYNPTDEEAELLMFGGYD